MPGAAELSWGARSASENAWVPAMARRRRLAEVYILMVEKLMGIKKILAWYEE